MKFEELVDDFLSMDQAQKLQKIREIRRNKYSATEKKTRKKAKTSKKKIPAAQKLLKQLSSDEIKELLKGE